MPTPPPGATISTFQIGTYTALTDTFNLVFDCNDFTSTFVHWNSIKITPPDEIDVRGNNMRTPGERISRIQYKNGHITVAIMVRATTAQLVVNKIRTLRQAVRNENLPYVIRFAFPGAAAYTYFDVAKCTWTPPYDPQEYNAGWQSNIAIDFECQPGMRGDRQVLQNYVVNPGFEAPCGGSGAPAVQVFGDPLANTNAYAVVAGSAPTLASSVMTIPNGTQVKFGSSAWGAVQLWQIRWQFATGLTPTFYLHYTDANNLLRVQIAGGTMFLTQVVGGTVHNVASGAATLTNGNFYWLQFTQFPTTTGNAPFVQATLFNDTGPGTIGSTVLALGPGATFDAVTALIGQPQISASGAAMNVGGAFGNVHALWLFGPGGWTTMADGGTGPASLAWDQNTANTIPIGTSSLVPVTSLAAGRIDCPPAGTVQAQWVNANTSSLANLKATGAIPTTNGVSFSASAWAKSSGLGVAATLTLQVLEYSSAGGLLRTDAVQTLTGNQAAWTQLSGSITTGASCAFVVLAVQAADTNAGASANATVWFENCQLWLTANGVSMPYCELRFMASPAQLVVSGVLGDMPARAWTAMGTYLPSSGSLTSTPLLFLLGERAQATTQMTLAGSYSVGNSGATPILDATCFGGRRLSVSVIGDTFVLDAFSAFLGLVGNQGIPEAPVVGAYHLWARVLSAESAGNLSKIALATQWAENINGFVTGLSQMPSQTPIKTSNIFNAVDVGQLYIPPVPTSALKDLTQVNITLALNWNDSGAGANGQVDWWMLLPDDGPLFIATVTDTSPSSFSASWLWVYADGLPNQYGKPSALSMNMGASTAAGGAPLPSPATGVASNIVNLTSNIAVSSAASPYLSLDPSQTVNGVSGINELVGVVADQSVGTWSVLPLFTELEYSPLYNYPR